MFQDPVGQTPQIFPLVIGSLVILLALLNKSLLRLMGLKPLSEVFTTPRFQRSARITETLGRLFLVVLGVGFLIQGVGPQFVSDAVIHSTSLVVLGFAGLIVLAMVGVVLAHWKV